MTILNFRPMGGGTWRLSAKCWGGSEMLYDWVSPKRLWVLLLVGVAWSVSLLFAAPVLALERHASLSGPGATTAVYPALQPGAVIEPGNESVASVGSNEAMVEASIDAVGEPTSYWVEYGLTAAYGQSTPVQSVGAPDEAVSVAVKLSGLQPGVTYHYRFVASNAAGTSDGPDATFTTGSTVASTSELPDNREYELVSSDGGQAEIYSPATQFEHLDYPFEAAADGDAVAYAGEPTSVGGDTGFLGNGHANQWLAKRGAHGWEADVITPPERAGEASELYLSDTVFQSFTSELADGILESEATPVAGMQKCEQGEDLYARSSADGSYRTLLPALPNCGHPLFAGTAAGESEVFFQDEAALTANAMDANELEDHGNPAIAPIGKPCEFDCDLYEVDSGVPRLVSELPDHGGVVSNASFGGFNADDWEHAEIDLSGAISANGSRVFWTDTQPGPEMEHVYVLENGEEEVQVSGSEPAEYWTATPDGRYAFYTESGALWRFDTQSNTREALVSTGGKGENAGVLGVVGINTSGEDGAYVYLVATAVLTHVANGQGAEPTANEPNMYLLHDGETRFIATLAHHDGDIEIYEEGVYNNVGDWGPSPSQRAAEVTPDGLHVVFQSERSLTGYDNYAHGDIEGTEVSEDVEEAYVYSANDGQLVCVSCNPSGIPPSYSTSQHPMLRANYLGLNIGEPRWISEEGNRVFFSTVEPLTNTAVSGALGVAVEQVYEWEREGEDTCTNGSASTVTGGCTYLLSGAGGPRPSVFVDASATGGDVFFISSARLTPDDRGELQELYDAHECSTASPCFQVSSTACTGTDCQGVPPASPIFATPASVTAEGPGNPSMPAAVPATKSKPKNRCAKGMKLDRGRCGRRKKSRKEKASRRLGSARSGQGVRKATHDRRAK